MPQGIENREGESLIENVLNEATHDILEGDELDKLLDECEKQPSGLYEINVDGDSPPNFNDLTKQYQPEETLYMN